MAVGGGVGGLVVVVIALFLGVDPGQLGLDGGGTDPGATGGRAQTSDSAQQFQAHIDQCDLQQANTDTICRVVATTESLEDVWHTQLPDQIGMRWVQPHTTIFPTSGPSSDDPSPAPDSEAAVAVSRRPETRSPLERW